MATVSPPLVSVVVPVFNGERYLPLSLDSALRQTMGSLEIIVVNDGSTDATAEIARQYEANHQGRVIHVEQANAGLPGARNTAIRRASGRYLALLDSDDVWLPEHLERVVPVLEADSGVALTHANITFIGPDGQSLSTPENRWPEGAARNAFRALFLRQEHVSCPTVVCRRDLVVTLGGFDPAFSYLGCEDRDLWLRISAFHRIRYIPWVTALYRVHPAGMSRNVNRMRLARKLLVEKHSSAPPGRQLRRAAIAAVDADTGNMFLERQEHLVAAWYFCRSIVRDPGSRAAWRGLFAVSSSVRRGPGA